MTEDPKKLISKKTFEESPAKKISSFKEVSPTKKTNEKKSSDVSSFTANLLSNVYRNSLNDYDKITN